MPSTSQRRVQMWETSMVNLQACEALFAKGALIGLLACVYPHVPREMLPPVESLIADGATHR